MSVGYMNQGSANTPSYSANGYGGYDYVSYFQGPMYDPEMDLTTSVQVSINEITSEHDIPYETSHYDKYRKMRRHPIINLARKFSIAPILASTWAVEGTDPEEIEHIKDQILPLRNFLLRTALYGLSDFGWKPYEKIFTYTEAGRLGIDKIKPLKNDVTRVRYDKRTGRFLGLTHVDQFTGIKYYIDAEHSLFVNFDDEGLGEYGTPNMAIAESSYDNHTDCNEIAKRYDKKMAGTFLVIKYPTGTTAYGPSREKTPNDVIADKVGAALMANGRVSIPQERDEMAPSNSEKWIDRWKLEFLDPAGKQADFVNRLNYLDKSMLRSFDITERSVIEGEFGTKAESGVHTDAVLMMAQLRHEMITELFNWHLVNQITRADTGIEGSARIVAQPLSDEKKLQFAKIFEAIIADPGAGPQLIDKINDEEILRALDIPVREVINIYDTTGSIDEYGAEWRSDTDLLEPYIEPGLFGFELGGPGSGRRPEGSAAIKQGARDGVKENERGARLEQGKTFTKLPSPKARVTIDQVSGMLAERGYSLDFANTRTDMKTWTTFYKVSTATGESREFTAKDLTKFLATEDAILF
jgi:hypothetical protein